jgi:hypothetical protein
VCPYPKEEEEEEDILQNVICVGIQNQLMDAEFYRKSPNILNVQN